MGSTVQARSLWRPLAAAALVTAVLLAPFPPAGAQPSQGAEPHADAEERCEYDVPALAEGVVDDPGGEYALRVLVLLDGPTRKRGVEVLDRARLSYEPLGIVLEPRFRTVRLEGDDRDPGALIREARDLLGGQVPHGYDVVHVFTTKDIAGWGLANCIGGVATRRFAFSVSEEAQGRGPMLTADHELPWLWGDFTANVVAHELGHLMGGQHQLANCAEGAQPDDDLPRPCSLMDTSLNMSLKFSIANGAVVRTHAVNYLERPRR